MKTVGIVGFGSFGKFLAEKLDAYCTVLVYSKSGKPNKWAVDMARVAQADYLILAIPLDAYEKTLTELKPHLADTTVIVDVCSVKEKPVAIIRSLLPKQRLVASHPLFGPESAADSLAGHMLVLCPEISDATAVKKIERFASSQGLIVKKMTAQAHDTEMATVQGLTFFIAHVLKNCKLHELELSTPSFKRLLHLAELEKSHSEDLFYTIQIGNTQTKAIREQFIKTAIELNEAIEKHEGPMITI